MKIKEAIEYIGGFKYVIDTLNIHSSAGRRILYALPFLKVPEEIKHEIEKTDWLIDKLNDEVFSQKLELTQMKLGQLRDIANTLSRLKYNNTLDDIELFEIKHLAILAHSIGKEVQELKVPSIEIPNLADTIEILDPQGKMIPQFHIYNEYSATLASIRSEINRIPHSDDTEDVINRLRLKEKREEDKVRVELTNKLQPYTEELKTALNEMGTLDLLIAKAYLAKEFRLIKPIFAEGETSLNGLFNPEIERSLKNQGKEFQPISITIPSKPTLITGANMTGKTVLLKSIALAQALAQFGFHVPASSAKFAPVDRIILCTTDEQDELSGLSSFAAEMIRLNKMTEHIENSERLLVLIDELARTTNPTEGKAIVGGVLNFLSEHKVSSLITTHYTIDTLCRKLKVKGFRLKDENVKITIHNINNYIDYSLEEIQEEEVPHEAIYIAEILGISNDLLHRIKANLNEKKITYMQQSKLNINFDDVQLARDLASNIAKSVQSFVDNYTTVSVERTLCRLIGINDTDQNGVPLPNIVVDAIKDKGIVDQGALFFVGNAVIETKQSPQQIAERIVKEELDITSFTYRTTKEIEKALQPYINESIERIVSKRINREEQIATLGEGPRPYLYVIVATGNIYEDVRQAEAAARQGADIIAVIRTTGQSLLDYVPYGATTEGFGGTYATQENFRIMREALDKVGKENGKYVRLCNYCSGLCMPEIAAMGALEGLDVMLNDALYGILFRDINMQRTMIDQFMSRVINGFAGVIINTGEDNYLTTADAVEEAHTVLASDFINEQLALMAGLPEEQMGLGHAFEMDPDLENGFLMELAQAQMIREIFPKAPLKYMPPTKFMTGNIFKGHLQDALFNMIGIWTSQGIQLLGMPTEAIHTPFMSDRYLAIENAQYIFNNMRSIGEEVEFKKDGMIQKRAQEVLSKTIDLLKELESKGLFSALEEGIFGGVKRPKNGGKGLAGVSSKGEHYYNPFIALMKK